MVERSTKRSKVEVGEADESSQLFSSEQQLSSCSGMEAGTDRG